jgi:hypothetical protein
MRKVMLGLAAAGLVFTAVPAFSQVGVEVGPGGAGVQIGRDRDREFYRRDRYDRDYRRGCRTIVERHRSRNGDFVERRVRRCD